MKKRIGPLYNRRHPITEAQRRVLSKLVAELTLHQTAKRLGCSVGTVEQLVTGGGCSKECAERVGAALDALVVAA